MFSILGTISHPVSFSQVAFDKLTVDNAYQQASAAANAADQQAGFDIRMAKAEHDAGGMKASIIIGALFFSAFSNPSDYNYPGPISGCL